MKHQSPLRRAVLASLALLTFAVPVAASSASGCTSGFEPISQVDGSLRVLAVAADKPYANPGDQVHFQMTYDDGAASITGPRPIKFLWLSGCFDPDGDDYYGCYTQLASAFADPASLSLGSLGQDSGFTLTLPADLISRRPKPTGGAPYYGTAIVFFAVCAGGTILPVKPTGTGEAGSFPLGCFDENGQQLGADSFVPGYVDIYAFEDGRTNGNPKATGLTINGESWPAGPRGPSGGRVSADGALQVAACPVAEDVRISNGGCGKVDPFKACPEYQISVVVPPDVAEHDPSTQGTDGTEGYETVWVDYFADNGDIDNPVLLVSTGGMNQSDFSVNWIAPPPAADGGPLPLVKFWAVVHDSRGGETVLERYFQVQ